MLAGGFVVERTRKPQWDVDLQGIVVAISTAAWLVFARWRDHESLLVISRHAGGRDTAGREGRRIFR